jgi:hypothetical protein
MRKRYDAMDLVVFSFDFDDWVRVSISHEKITDESNLHSRADDREPTVFDMATIHVGILKPFEDR